MTVVDDFLREAVGRVFPGAAYSFGTANQVHVGVVGTTELNGTAVNDHTLYDLASLTKPICTALLTEKLVDDGVLSLDTDVKSVLPKFPHPNVCIRNLLLHDSGLPAYLVDISEGANKEAVLDLVMQQPLTAATGRRTTYSCLGFVVLQHVLQTVAASTLDMMFDTVLAKPLRLRNTSFGPVHSAAPTTLNVAAGIVHDPLARALGGVSGNAGLFSNILDMTKFARLCLQVGGPLGTSSWGEWTVRSGPLMERALGWDKKSEDSTAGERFGSDCYGHTGFTGTMIWINHNPGFFAVLLTNAVMDADGKMLLKRVRKQFCDAAWEAVLS